MTGLLGNLLLATCWVFLTGNFESANYFFGLIIGYLVIAFLHRQVPSLEGYPYRFPRFIAFLAYFFWTLLLSNLKVAMDILTPPFHMKPGVLGFKTSTKTDLELTLLANLISMTPGSLVLDLSEDKTTLFVHTMFLDDEKLAQRDLQDLEQRLLQVIR